MTDKFPEDTRRLQGKDALHNNIAAAKAIAATIKTTLGPRGMDKMIVDSQGNVVITNDGVTILREMHLEHPAARLLVDLAKTQEQKVGDGTTTAVIIAGELLSQAEKLIDKGIHPTTIIKAYALAENHAQKHLHNLSSPLEDRSTLLNIAQTAMTGKGIERYKTHLANLLIDALHNTHASDSSITGHHGLIPSDHLKFEIEIGPTTDHSRLIPGLIIDKERVHPNMPTSITDAKILLVDFPLEVRSTEIEAKIQLSNPSQLQQFLDHEEQHIKEIIAAITSSGANVVLCQRGIDDLAQYYLSKENILALRRVKRSDMELLQRTIRSRIISTPRDIASSVLGRAELVEERLQGESQQIFIEGCSNSQTVTILLCAPTPQLAEECRRAAADALGDLRTALLDRRVLPGAGAAEIEITLSLEKLSHHYLGRTQLAIRAYAQALESIPLALAENAGLDPLDSLTSLRTMHEQHQSWLGINCHPPTSSPDLTSSPPQVSNLIDTKEHGIIEPLSIKTVALASATQVAEMILRIDDIILGRTKNSDSSLHEKPHSYNSRFLD